MPYEDKCLEDSEIEKIVENYKNIFEEFNRKTNLENITKLEVQEMLFNENFMLKIPSILYL